ncbi:MAG: peptidyl-tRNA hydrolase [Candidatus Peribacteria bacterium]|nr:MAG: peptidyl-tRNA hydrolase [Candidatus Peribacteria bacterium]
MNRSGQSIASVASYYDIIPENIFVIHDEIDFPTAKIALKKGGSHAGHNGLKDTIEKLGTKDFWRLRIGIDRPITKEMITDYVLGSFTPNQKDEIRQQRDAIYEFCLAFIREE